MKRKKVYVTKKASFEAAHHLNNYDGKCSRVHGHSYKLEVTFSGYIDLEKVKSNCPATEAMVCDFSHLKKLLKKMVENFDHSDLNDWFDQPTAEVMAIVIFESIAALIGTSDYEVCSVKLWETEDSYAEYKGE